MELNSYFKSIIEQDKCAVVICNLEHVMIYMNPAAISNYEKRGGASLLGKSIFDCHNGNSNELIKKIVEWFKESTEHNIMYTSYNEKKNRDVYVVALRDENKELIGYYEKHEFRNRETAKPYQFID